MQVEISTECESRLTVVFNRVEWLQIEADDQLISNQHTIQIVSLPSDNMSLSTQIELQIELFPAGQPSTTRTTCFSLFIRWLKSRTFPNAVSIRAIP